MLLNAPFLLFYPCIFLLFRNASYVASVASINGDGLAFVNEERNTHLSTCFERCRFSSVCSCIALYTRLTVITKLVFIGISAERTVPSAVSV